MSYIGAITPIDPALSGDVTYVSAKSIAANPDGINFLDAMVKEAGDLLISDDPSSLTIDNSETSVQTGAILLEKAFYSNMTDAISSKNESAKNLAVDSGADINALNQAILLGEPIDITDASIVPEADNTSIINVNAKDIAIDNDAIDELNQAILLSDPVDPILPESDNTSMIKVNAKDIAIDNDAIDELNQALLIADPIDLTNIVDDITVDPEPADTLLTGDGQSTIARLLEQMLINELQQSVSPSGNYNQPILTSFKPQETALQTISSSLFGGYVPSMRIWDAQPDTRRPRG